MIMIIIIMIITIIMMMMIIIIKTTHYLHMTQKETLKEEIKKNRHQINGKEVNFLPFQSDLCTG